MPLRRSRVEESAEHKQVIIEFFEVGDGSFIRCFELGTSKSFCMGFLESSFLFCKSILIFLAEFAVVDDLILKPCQFSLQGRSLEYLCFLVRIDLFLCDKFIKGYTRIVGNNAFGFVGGSLRDNG